MREQHAFELRSNRALLVLLSIAAKISKILLAILAKKLQVSSLEAKRKISKDKQNYEQYFIQHLHMFINQGKKIQKLIPTRIGMHHDHLLTKYINTISTTTGVSNKIIHMLNKDNNLLSCQILNRLIATEQVGIHIIGVIKVYELAHGELTILVESKTMKVIATSQFLNIFAKLPKQVIYNELSAKLATLIPQLGTAAMQGQPPIIEINFRQTPQCQSESKNCNHPYLFQVKLQKNFDIKGQQLSSYSLNQTIICFACSAGPLGRSSWLGSIRSMKEAHQQSQTKVAEISSALNTVDDFVRNNSVVMRGTTFLKMTVALGFIVAILSSILLIKRTQTFKTLLHSSETQIEYLFKMANNIAEINMGCSTIILKDPKEPSTAELCAKVMTELIQAKATFKDLTDLKTPLIIKNPIFSFYIRQSIKSEPISFRFSFTDSFYEYAGSVDVLSRVVELKILSKDNLLIHSYIVHDNGQKILPSILERGIEMVIEEINITITANLLYFALVYNVCLMFLYCLLAILLCVQAHPLCEFRKKVFHLFSFIPRNEVDKLVQDARDFISQCFPETICRKSSKTVKALSSRNSASKAVLSILNHVQQHNRSSKFRPKLQQLIYNQSKLMLPKISLLVHMPKQEEEENKMVEDNSNVQMVNLKEDNLLYKSFVVYSIIALFMLCLGQSMLGYKDYMQQLNYHQEGSELNSLLHIRKNVNFIRSYLHADSLNKTLLHSQLGDFYKNSADTVKWLGDPAPILKDLYHTVNIIEERIQKNSLSTQDARSLQMILNSRLDALQNEIGLIFDKIKESSRESEESQFYKFRNILLPLATILSLLLYLGFQLLCLRQLISDHTKAVNLLRMIPASLVVKHKLLAKMIK